MSDMMKMTQFFKCLNLCQHGIMMRILSAAGFVGKKRQNLLTGNYKLFKNECSNFCGMLNCADCLKNKTRAFPLDNPGKLKRGLICQVCNKKFLYRDVSGVYF